MRLFVAVWPPEDVLDLVASLPRPDVDGLRWTTRDQWHVTLRFLGEVESAEEVADAVAGAGAAAAQAVMGPDTRKLGSHLVMAPVGGLDDIAGAVVRATAHVGEPPEDRPFRGHLTLARVRRGRRVDLRPHTGLPVRASWPVDRISVVRSSLHPKGARYDTLAEVPLGDPLPGPR